MFILSETHIWRGSAVSVLVRRLNDWINRWMVGWRVSRMDGWTLWRSLTCPSSFEGTNDKPGGPHYVLRWTSPRVVKQTHVPLTEWKYPYMGWGPTCPSTGLHLSSLHPSFCLHVHHICLSPRWLLPSPETDLRCPLFPSVALKLVEFVHQTEQEDVLWETVSVSHSDFLKHLIRPEKSVSLWTKQVADTWIRSEQLMDFFISIIQPDA